MLLQQYVYLFFSDNALPNDSHKHIRHNKAIEAQKERIEALIEIVKEEIRGTKEISFSAFSNEKIIDLVYSLLLQ